MNIYCIFTVYIFTDTVLFIKELEEYIYILLKINITIHEEKYLIALHFFTLSINTFFFYLF